MTIQKISDKELEERFEVVNKINKEDLIRDKEDYENKLKTINLLLSKFK